MYINLKEIRNKQKLKATTKNYAWILSLLAIFSSFLGINMAEYAFTGGQ
jgi:3-methyladenine DNA glycosylase Tag